VQEDLSETTPAVEPLCRILLAEPQPAEVQQHIPQIVQVRSLAVCICLSPAHGPCVVLMDRCSCFWAGAGIAMMGGGVDWAEDGETGGRGELTNSGGLLVSLTYSCPANSAAYAAVACVVCVPHCVCLCLML